MLLKNLYSPYNSATLKPKTKLHQANKSLNKNLIRNLNLNCSGTTLFHQTNLQAYQLPFTTINRPRCE